MDNQAGGIGSERSFAHSAATTSLAMPLITMLLGGAWQANGIQGRQALLGLLCMICIGIGTVLAIVALCRIPSGSDRSLTRRAVLALVFNGVFVVIFGLAFMTGFSKAVKARQTRSELLWTAQTVRANMRKSFDPELGFTNGNTGDVTRLLDQMENASADLKGQEGLMMKAWAAHLRDTDRLSQKRQALYDELGGVKALDACGLGSRQELQERQGLVRRYKGTCEEMRQLMVNSMDSFRAELKKLGVAPEKREEAVKQLRARLATRTPLLLEIRDLETRMWDDVLRLLTLLETNWGTWNCPEGRIRFEDEQTWQQYNALLADFTAAAKEQTAAQKKLVSLK